MSWSISNLGKIGEFKAGFGFPTEFQGRTIGDFPFAKVGDISAIARSGEKFIGTAGNYVDNEDLSKIKAKTIPEGTIVFAKIGEAISQNFRAVTSCEMLIDNNTMGLIPDLDIVDVNYLFHFMCKLDLYRFTGATTVPALRKSTLEEIEIPLPPLTEQKRIAAILDKADAIRRKRRQAIQLADEFLRSVFLDMFGDPITNPKGLRVVPLANLCKKITDGTHQSPRWEDSGVPFLFISNIENGTINYETHRYISKETLAELTRITPIEKDDILYTTVGSYGNVALVPGDKEFCFQRHIAHIKPNHRKVKPRFLAGMLESSVIKRQADALVRGVAQKTLNLRELKEIRVFDISNKEQQKYLNIIAPLYQTKDNFERFKAELKKALGSLSQRAFSGEL